MTKTADLRSSRSPFSPSASIISDLILRATSKTIIPGADIVSEDRIAEALEFGIKSLQPLLKLQEQMKKEAGKPDIDPKLDLVPEEVVKQVRELASKEIDRVNRHEKTKESRDEALKKLIDSIFRGYPIPLIYLHHIKTQVARPKTQMTGDSMTCDSMIVVAGGFHTESLAHQLK